MDEPGRAGTATEVSVSASEFARAFRHVPGPVAIVLTRTADGPVRGITATSATSLSGSPPMMVFSVDVKTAFADEVRLSRRYSVNFLAADRDTWARAFSAGGAALDALVPVLRDGRSGAPTLATGTTAVLECDVADIVPGGDHWIVTGRITHSRVQTDASPLLHLGGRYGEFTPAEAVAGASRPPEHLPRPCPSPPTT